jgi:hypothetical protein
MLLIVAGGTAYVCVAKSTRVSRAVPVNVLAALEVPTHLVGWISHPNSERIQIIC